MSSSEPVDGGSEQPHLVCRLENAQGIVDTLTSVRWKKHQDALVEISEHGIVLVVEESGCLQAKVYLKKELFYVYDYGARGQRTRFGLGLGLFVDCLNSFTVPGGSSHIEIRYPGPDMQLMIKGVDSPDMCIYAEIRTRIPETFSWDHDFETAGNAPICFTVKVLKEAIDDLEWPGSSIQIVVNPDPASVTLRGEGYGDLQIDFLYYANTDLLNSFQCDHQVSYRYKYKFLHATTSNIPASVMKDNRASRLTIGRGCQQIGRIAYIEFYVKPEEDIGNEAG